MALISDCKTNLAQEENIQTLSLVLVGMTMTNYCLVTFQLGTELSLSAATSSSTDNEWSLHLAIFNKYFHLQDYQAGQPCQAVS